MSSLSFSHFGNPSCGLNDGHPPAMMCLCLLLFAVSGQGLGLTEVGPEVGALVSHATLEFLRGLLEKLTHPEGHSGT